MAYTEIFWMACDSTEQLRAEYGPFLSRGEAEVEARKLGFGYLLRYEHLLGEDEEIQEVRCIFIELPGTVPSTEVSPFTLHTRCAACGESAAHSKNWQAEVWADTSPNASDNVYFKLVRNDESDAKDVALGVWTTHMAILRGHQMDRSEVTSVFAK